MMGLCDAWDGLIDSVMGSRFSILFPIFLHNYFHITDNSLFLIMISPQRNHHLSLTKDFDNHNFKLPSIKKRGSFDMQSHISSNASPSHRRGSQSPITDLSKFPESPFPGVFSLEIPKIAYSAFKKKPKTIQQRRLSDFSMPIAELLQSRYNIQVPESKPSGMQNTLKESIINKKTFKRIESNQIDFYSKNFGQKLIRVQELVIDPLLSDMTE